MESTTPFEPTTFCPVTVTSLAATFTQVPDPRRQASVQYPLPAVLALAVSAMLFARTSVLAMANRSMSQMAPPSTRWLPSVMSEAWSWPRSRFTTGQTRQTPN